MVRQVGGLPETSGGAGSQDPQPPRDVSQSKALIAGADWLAG